MKCSAERGPMASAIRPKIDFGDRLFVPTDGTRLPVDWSGDLGESPFLMQLSGKRGARQRIDDTPFRDQYPCPLRVQRQTHAPQQNKSSITSAACASSVRGTVRPW
jgi:hypothetical protein